MGRQKKENINMTKSKKKAKLSGNSMRKMKLKQNKTKKLPTKMIEKRELLSIAQKDKENSKKLSLKNKKKKKAGDQISGVKVIDFGLEELKTWGVDTKVKGNKGNDNIEKDSSEKIKKKRKSSHDSFGLEKKTKLDRIQEREAKVYEVREGFNEKVTEFKEKGLSDMVSWKDLHVPEPLLCALAEDKFTEPTPIQRLCLPSAIRDRLDIVGAAETGSGKTLAFGIPVLHHILEYKNRKSQKEDESDEDSDRNSDEDSDDVDQESDNGSENMDDDSETNDNMNEDSGEDEESENNSENMDEDSENNDMSGSDAGDGDDSDGDNDAEVETLGEQEVSGAGMEQLGVGFGVDVEAIGGVGFQGSEENCDLPPEEEDIEELQDDELGCVNVVNDVEFEWLEKPQKLRAKGQKEAPLLALMLCPTRELAIQVAHHLERISRHTDIKIATVVGGMSSQKQERVLKKAPEIVVATPGRLWELIQEGQPHLSKVEYVRYLVIDEADRMVEKGHFQELTQLLEMINSNETEKRHRQTFIFSATLSLVHSGPERVIQTKRKKKKFKKLNEKEKLQALMTKIGLKPKSKIFDLTRKQGTAESLVESRIVCDKTEKDLYMYYFVKQYPGRTLVFANSKDCIRRMVSIFTLLQCCPLALHADMHQKQRLKNLDRFKASPNGLLLATDVAARGLDIPDVQHVIHYQVPRTSENYVHRSGRTARAYKEGLSIMLVSPDDLKNYRKIIKTLNRDEELPLFPVESQYITGYKNNLKQAVNIDKLEHQQSKHKKQNSWFEKAAKEMEIELDERQLLHDLGDSHEQAMQRQKLHHMRLQLKHMLSQPVLSLQFSGKYPTKSGRLLIPYMPEDKDAVNRIKADLHKAQQVKDNVEKTNSQNPSKKLKRKQKFFRNKKFAIKPSKSAS